MTKPAETETALALFPKLNLPSVTGITEEMSKSFGTMYTRIEEDIAALPTDMSVKANREKVASTAYKISRTKTGLDEAAADVAGDAKQIVDAVNAERRQLKNTLDILRDKAREPLDAWEEAEKKRRQNVADAIGSFQNVAIDHASRDSSELAMVLDNLNHWQFKEEHYGEQIEDVRDAHKIAVERITEMMDAAGRREAEAAELEQLRREKAEREEADRIRREQEEAEKAARMAEEKRLIDAENERIRQDEERARIAKEAEEKAARDAAEKIAAEQKAREDAERRAQEAEEREAKRIEDEKRREADAIEAQKEAAARAEEDAKRRELKAQAEERARIAEEQAKKDEADRQRAADVAHRKKINSAAVAGLMKACELDEKTAQNVLIAIYKEQVPHVAISY